MGTSGHFIEHIEGNLMFDQIKHHTSDGIDVMVLRGQFIGGTETDNLRTALAEAAEKEGGNLVLNLADVSYLNSTALGVLISANSNFLKHNRRVVLCQISKSIENIFVITKLTLVFEIFASQEEAIKSFTHS